MIKPHCKDVEPIETPLEVSEGTCNSYTKTCRTDLKLTQMRKMVENLL